jgi:hypothetical protein
MFVINFQYNLGIIIKDRQEEIILHLHCGLCLKFSTIIFSLIGNLFLLYLYTILLIVSY